MKVIEHPATRRSFLGLAGTAALTGLTATAATAAAATTPAAKLKIIGVSCSPRKGMTTAMAVQAALDAAKTVNSRIEVELIDLGGLQFSGYAPKTVEDDFTALLPKLQDPAIAGLIIGSPSYFRGMSSLCKAFIERCMPLREPKMLLADKPIAALATGGYRNGGQEMTIQQIQAAMLCFEMVLVGGQAPAFQGGTLASTKDSILGDEIGLTAARNTGLHLAKMAVRLACG